MTDQRPTWSESDSEKFLTFSEIITPSRPEQMAVLADLVPAEPHAAFALAELGCGGGELAAFLLERFPNARYLGLDGSQRMLQASGDRLGRFGGRVQLRGFRLEDPATWTLQLPDPVRCICSSLVVHHLPHAEKRSLYRRLHQVLEPGGALLLIDIVQPRSGLGAAALSQNWDGVVRQQSLAMTGSVAAFDEFKQEGWNCYSHPDPMDLPAPLFEQLQWLAEAGFQDVDCFWQRGGHAVFGGYKQG